MLDAATQIIDPTNQKPAFGGDLEISVNILEKTLKFNKDNKERAVVGDEIRDHFVGVASNLVDPVNTRTWRRLQKVRSKMPISGSWDKLHKALRRTLLLCLPLLLRIS